MKQNLVYATSKAKILINAIGEELLASPEMTAKWEQQLKAISEGHSSPARFMEQTNKMIHYLVEKVTKNSAEWSFSEDLKEQFVPAKQVKRRTPTKLGNCKLCDGQIIDKGTFYGCSNYQKNQCKFTISKKIAGKNITQMIVKTLLKDGITDWIEGFKGKQKDFSAKLIWDEKEQKIKFSFDQ